MEQKSIIGKILYEKKVYIYGAGQIGKKISLFLSKQLGIETILFVDQNKELNNKQILDGINCRLFEELDDKQYAFIISSNYKNYNEIMQLLDDNYINSYIHYEELLSDLRLESIWINQHIVSDNKKQVKQNYQKDIKEIENRIAVYTCIVGKYDDLIYPDIIDEKCDYYYISDYEPKDLGVYRWIDVNEVVPKNCLDSKDQNRYCKMNGNKIFKKYKYSIYVDGCVKIRKSLFSMIGDIGISGLALFKHETRNCIYNEGIIVAMLGLVDSETVKEQLREYAQLGIKTNFGLFAGGVIVRDNENEEANTITDLWWNEYFKWKTRDQISLMYAIWRSNIKIDRIGIINNGESRLKDPRIEWMKHK